MKPSPALALPSLIAAMVAATAPLAAAPVPEKPKAQPQEQIGPAAVGGAKRYLATAAVTCLVSTCVADFGRKKGKVRTIETLSCVLISDGSGLYATVTLTASKDIPDFILPPAANTWTEAGTYTVFERTSPFSVPGDAPFSMELWTSGDQASAFCTATGTIE